MKSSNVLESLMKMTGVCFPTRSQLPSSVVALTARSRGSHPVLAPPSRHGRAVPINHLFLFADLIEHHCARVMGKVMGNGEGAGGPDLSTDTIHLLSQNVSYVDK